MKRLILITAISLLLIGNMFAMPDENTPGKFPFKKLGHKILVKVKINGSKDDYNFVIDTGGLTFIDKTVAQELGLKQRGPMAKISTLNLSGYQIENIFCLTTFNFNMFRGTGIPIHGIIGSDLMERFKVTFDFQKGFVIFSTDTSALSQPNDGSIFLPFHNHPVNHAPIIKFKINEKIIEGMIDTGQPYPVVLPIEDFEKYMKLNDADYIQSKGLMIKWPQTKLQYNFLTKLKIFEFGSMKINNVMCIFGEIPSVLSMPLIGMDLLSQFKVVINYPKDEILLIPSTDMHFADNQFSFGLNLDLSEKNEIFVVGVWENSPAEKANIQAGDRVISFNSEKVTSENMTKLMEMLKDDNIKSMDFEIENQNGMRKLKLNKAMLF
jgi:predicted aspartyl protease